MHPDQYIVLHFTPSEGVVAYGPYEDQAKACSVRDARLLKHPTAIIKCEQAHEDA
jgi:hypothetical protein